MRCLVCLAVMSRLWGHDMWIETAPMGQAVGVKLRVGQELVGDAIPRRASMIREFVAVDGNGRSQVMGREGSDPAGYVRAGAAVIAYWGQPSVAEMEGEKFNAYLAEEGLDQIGRVAKGAMVKDEFTRCAKTLVGGAADRTVGLPLELVAEARPARGGTLPVRLIYDGRAEAGVLVVAINKRKPGEKVTARTDRDGRVRLRLDVDGLWLVKAVKMVPGTIFRSYWASLTFQLEGM